MSAYCEDTERSPGLAKNDCPPESVDQLELIGLLLLSGLRIKDDGYRYFARYAKPRRAKALAATTKKKVGAE